MIVSTFVVFPIAFLAALILTAFILAAFILAALVLTALVLAALTFTAFVFAASFFEDFFLVIAGFLILAARPLIIAATFITINSNHLLIYRYVYL